MRKLLCFLFILVLPKVQCFPETLRHIKANASPKIQTEAVKELIQRILPDRASDFLVEVNPDLQPDEKDAFKVESTEDGLVKITGTTGVAVATGFNYYLKYYINSQITWQTSNLKIPKTLPEVNITIVLNDPFRYYQNVCTTSYSFVWWNWFEWEKHIDWMALNGFNFVLAFNGQEAIWDRVYKQFNLSQNHIDEHFTGPAFLSWLRMGNMRGWGGGLSSAWHQRSLMLQKQILARMRSLGIIPILPAFAGHLPRAFKTLYPNAKMDLVQSWNHFNDTYCCPYFLDPTDDLFQQIGTAFLKEQIAEFGTDHVYNCDSFNENTPTVDSYTYLHNVGEAIYQAMTSVDSKAIWLIQNWFLVHDIIYWRRERVQAFLTSVPKGKMIILDLQSEMFPQFDRFNQYYGQPFIWCMLHNFGGTLGMYGSSKIIQKAVIDDRNETDTMVGIGLTMEGINQNYVIYDLMIETAWWKEPQDLDLWFKNYSVRRYGVEDDEARTAWLKLQKTIYNYDQVAEVKGKYAITASPSLKLQLYNWYSTSDLLEAWSSLLKVESETEGFLYDVTDLTRQFLQFKGDQIYEEIKVAYKSKDLESFNISCTQFLQLFNDLEDILGSNEHFLLGKWIESARNAAASDDNLEQDLYEYNAKNQITLWGPNGEIMNYAIKQWSGVVSNFLKPRWQMYLKYLQDVLMNKRPFNQTEIKRKIFLEVEEPFTFDKVDYPTEPNGDTLAIAQRIYEKWVHKRSPRFSVEESIETGDGILVSLV